jgi:hypothetical protein
MASLPSRDAQGDDRWQRAGIRARVGNDSLPGTGLADHLKSGGSLAKAREMVNYADTRTTHLYFGAREE